MGMSRCGRLILDIDTKGCEVAEQTSKKVEVNPQMLSTLKKWRIHTEHEPRGNFESSVVRPLGILTSLVKRQIGYSYYKSGIFYGRPSMSPFIYILFSLEVKTGPKLWWIGW